MVVLVLMMVMTILMGVSARILHGLRKTLDHVEQTQLERSEANGPASP